MNINEIIFDLFNHFMEVKGYNNTLWAVNRTLYKRGGDMIISFDTETCNGSLYITFVNTKTGHVENHFIYLDDTAKRKIQAVKQIG